MFSYGVAGLGDPVNVADLQRMMAYLRVVIVQTKATRGEFLAYNDVWTTNNAGTVTVEGVTPTALSPFATVRAPLRLGLARSAKVISDKTYTLSDTRQAVNIKTKLKYVKSWYRSPSESVPKGHVLMFVMLYDQTGSLTPNVSSATFNFVSKCVYTDA